MLENTGDSARLFYLILLGMAVAVSVFVRYRGRLGSAMQQAAIWFLIFVGLIIAYGFKDQLLGQLSVGHAARSGNEIALARGPDGHFHATLEVNGQDVTFLIDTGASDVVLTRRDAARVGLDPDNLSYTIPASTANGTVWGAPVRLGEVTLAGETEFDLRAIVNGGELDISLLGMDYLNRYRSWRVEGDTFYLMR